MGLYLGLSVSELVINRNDKFEMNLTSWNEDEEKRSLTKDNN